MRRQRPVLRTRLDCRHQRFQDHRGLAGAGDAGDGGEPPARDRDVQGVHGVDRRGGHAQPCAIGCGFATNRILARITIGYRLDRKVPPTNRVRDTSRPVKLPDDAGYRPRPIRRQRRDHGTLAYHGRFATGQESGDARIMVRGDLVRRTLGHDAATLTAGARTHLDEPVGGTQHTHVVVDEHHRIAGIEQIMHDADQAFDIRRMQAGARLVQHIQHAGGLVAHRARQLRTLALAGRQRRRRAVQRQIPQSQLHQTAAHLKQRGRQRLRHLPHIGGQHGRHPLAPVQYVAQRPRGHLGQTV